MFGLLHNAICLFEGFYLNAFCSSSLIIEIDASNKKIIIPDLGDHRICMSSFILAILTGARAKIKNFETVFTSSPSFLKIMKNLGANFEIQK